MKKCSKCKLDKNENEFNRSSKNKDGLYGICKECRYRYRRSLKNRDYASIKIPDKKPCSKCKKLLPKNMFNKRIYSVDGLSSICKSCKSTFSRQQRIKVSKSDKVNVASKKCCHCKIIHKISEFNKDKYSKDGHSTMCKKCNRAHCKKYQKQCDPEIRRKRLRNYLKNNIQARLAVNIRNRVNKLIKRKPVSSHEALGCSVKDLIIHLENQFTKGMTWDNYSEWHIDHIIPLASFDLTDEEQFKQACHYTNLQLLWARDNIIKRANILTTKIS